MDFTSIAVKDLILPFSCALIILLVYVSIQIILINECLNINRYRIHQISQRVQQIKEDEVK